MECRHELAYKPHPSSLDDGSCQTASDKDHRISMKVKLSLFILERREIRAKEFSESVERSWILESRAYVGRMSAQMYLFSF